MPEIKWVLLHTPRAAAIPHIHTQNNSIVDWKWLEYHAGWKSLYTIITIYTCYFKPQYRKLLSTFWTVSSAKDTNNKSGAHFYHMHLCHLSDMPKAAMKHARPQEIGQSLTHHQWPVASMKKLLHWWHASKYIQRNRMWRNLGLGCHESSKRQTSKNIPNLCWHETHNSQVEPTKKSWDLSNPFTPGWHQHGACMMGYLREHTGRSPRRWVSLMHLARQGIFGRHDIWTTPSTWCLGKTSSVQNAINFPAKTYTWSVEMTLERNNLIQTCFASSYLLKQGFRDSRPKKFQVNTWASKPGNKAACNRW